MLANATRSPGSPVVVSDLVISYGDRMAVDSVSWSAEAGQVLAILGPNGAGKTSTVESLEGYRKPNSGTVRVLGLDPIVDATALAPRIGVMLQRNGVYLTMGAAEVIALFAAYYGQRALDPAALVSRLGLEGVAKTPWRRLSGGEQQRVSLALALVGRPEVLFLDEPTAMIDPGARQIVREIVAEQRGLGTCVILTTHDLQDAERLADQIVIMDGGRIVAQGSPSELMSAGSEDGITFVSDAGIDLSALGHAIGGDVRCKAGSGTQATFRAAVVPTPTNVAALTSWLASNGHSVGSIQAGQRSLEDVFVKLTASALEASLSEASSKRDRRRGTRGRSAGRNDSKGADK